MEVHLVLSNRPSFVGENYIHTTQILIESRIQHCAAYFLLLGFVHKVRVLLHDDGLEEFDELNSDR